MPAACQDDIKKGAWTPEVGVLGYISIMNHLKPRAGHKAASIRYVPRYIARA
jgi:hypothetical protein